MKSIVFWQLIKLSDYSDDQSDYRFVLKAYDGMHPEIGNKFLLEFIK